MKKISKNTEDTQKIAKEFFKGFKINKNQATIVGLFGNLGTGKTTFTQFIAKELKIKRKVNSPTFVIIKKYSLPKQKQVRKFSGGQNEISARSRKPLHSFLFEYIFHIDAYRLKNEKELFHLGWKEIISNKRHLVFIEWPENVIKALPRKYHKIHITHTKEGYRKFEIKTI